MSGRVLPGDTGLAIQISAWGWIGPPPIVGGLRGEKGLMGGGGSAHDSRHFFDMKVEMIKSSVKVKYKH